MSHRTTETARLGASSPVLALISVVPICLCPRAFFPDFTNRLVQRLNCGQRYT